MSFDKTNEFGPGYSLPVLAVSLASMHVALVAIPTLDPPGIFRNLEPDTRMAKRPFATVTGDAPLIDYFGFRSFGGHGYPLDWILDAGLASHSAMINGPIARPLRMCT